MKRKILTLVVLAGLVCAQPLAAVQDAPNQKPTKEEKSAAKEAEKRAKLEKKEAEKRAEQKKKDDERERRQQERAERWARDNPQPEPLKPAYPASLRPEFITYARQTDAAIQNAFNTIERSRIEFAMANQTAQQYLIVLRGAASNLGESQVAEAIAAYGQMAPVCQDAAWQAASNLLVLLAANRYPACIKQAIYLRAVADLTMRQNSQPAPQPAQVRP